MPFSAVPASRERTTRIGCTVIAVVWAVLFVVALLTGASPAKWVFGLIMTIVWTAMAAFLWWTSRRL